MPPVPPAPPLDTRNRMRRVLRNLRKGLDLAYGAGPRELIKFTVLGMISATVQPVTVLLGSMLVSRIAAGTTGNVTFNDVLPIIIGLWTVSAVQRAIRS